ncbi:MAG: transcription antitermination factor NusB [Rhodospirillales bacterium]|jgi:N utilization substance protein B|nr:transcription antitermination factor NusB [Rhodospirillales bacterium]
MTAPSVPTLRQRRTAARLAAVQVLYEMEVADAAVEAVLTERKSRQLPSVDNGAAERFVEPDVAFLEELVRGVVLRKEDIDRHLAAALTGRLVLSRLEVLLRAILRAGAYELLEMPDVPGRVVISEYLELAHAFYAGKEPPLVNAVLDQLATRLRTPSNGR